MKTMFKNKKGMTLVTVVIIMTVLVLLCAVLAEAVVQTLVISKRHRNIDYAYYAGESAIENWAALIGKQIVNKSDVGKDFPGTLNLTIDDSRKAYAEHIINHVIKLDPLTASSPQKIDIEGKALNEAEVQFEAIEYVGTEWNSTEMGSNSMDILIGIKAKASYSSTAAYNAGNKRVYAVKRFRVMCPVKNELEGAIYAIGDFYINGNKRGDVVKVKGDVFTFGSYAEKTTSLNQSYFGGIFAINGGLLNIYGNAYSRSFIRTGPYRPYDKFPGFNSSPSGNDSSRIIIFKDAVAECIQSFGNDDVTIVLGNAYTFDDIEINGQNSVIAVNGSFIGLSKGGGTINHDLSSAVVNSAMIHQQMQPGSKESKVAINGDVIIPGSTFKVNTLGLAEGTIEDASVAFNDDVGIPHYKWWSGWGAENSDLEYQKSLRSNKANINRIDGYYNQFQMHNMLKPFENTFNENEILAWVNRIRTNSFDRSVSGDLVGIAPNIVSANGTLYPRYLEDSYSEDKFNVNFYIANDITPIDKFRIDNIFSEGKIKYDIKYWEDKDDGVLSYEDLYGDVDGDEYDLRFQGKCGEIHQDLLNKVQRFAARNYDSTGWKFAGITEFDNILKALNTKKSGSNSIVYIERSYSHTDRDIDEIFRDIDFDKDGNPDNVDIYSVCADSRASGYNSDSKYFIIANEKRELTIRISGTFNGIIVTAGKVILEDGASVYGSIIAAGDGYYNVDDGAFIPKSMALTVPADETDLENGKFAAVSAIADGDSSTEPPYVDFFLGLTGGPNAPFTKANMIQVLLKARETTTGAAILEDIKKEDGSIDYTKVDDALAYLNKAARINLLEKFNNQGIYLYDIF